MVSLHHFHHTAEEDLQIFFSCTSYIYSEQTCKIHKFFAGWCNKLLSDGAHLVESDLMGQEDGFLTLVPKSVKS